jgi:hypothetical protein
MSIKIKHIVLPLLLLVLVGCTDFLDINKNPDKSVFVTPEQELPVVMFYAAQINYDHAEYGNYLTQTFTTGGKSQTGTYAYKSGWEFLSMNRHPQWRRHYYDLGVNINEMIKGAEAEKSYNYILIGRTIRLMSTLFTTDAFGDMPLSQAYTSVAPTYDTQEQVYTWMLKEADELLALYDNPDWTQAKTNKTISKSMDRIYAGDLSKWKLFTSGLKARILLRKLPNWDNTPASCQLIINAVDSALTVNWKEPDYNYDGGSGEKNCPWGAAQPAINAWESRKNEMDKSVPTKFLCVDMMGVYESPSGSKGKAEDPRIERLMTPRVGPTNDPSNKFRYLETNIGIGVSYKEVNYPDLFTSVFTKNTGYVSLMLTEELMLMKAEAMYWKGDKAGALDVMKAAVDVNIARHKPVDAVAYNIYVTKFKAMAKYFPTLTNFNIGHIMRHKYICMFLQPEQWTDMRRYNYSSDKDGNGITYDGAVIYPGLKRPYNLYEPYWTTQKYSDGSVKQVWIQRLNYDPETEEKYNKGELERLEAFRNADWLKKPMIWAVYNDAKK